MVARFHVILLIRSDVPRSTEIQRQRGSQTTSDVNNAHFKICRIQSTSALHRFNREEIRLLSLLNIKDVYCAFGEKHSL